MFKAATRYVIDQMNAAGGWNGEPVQLVEYDNQGGPAGASDKLKAALADGVQIIVQRSEEHTSELQSLMRISYAVFCLKKKKTDQKPERQNQARLKTTKKSV